jgi:hypothetical protein
MFAAGDIVGIGAVQVATRQFLLVQRDENAFVHGLLKKPPAFGDAAIAPTDAIGATELDCVVDKAVDGFVGKGACA